MSYDPDADATRNSPLTAAALRHPRKSGWGLTALAVIAAYAQMLLPYRWSNATVIILGTMLVAAFAAICYLAAKSKSADLWLAAVMALASPALATIIAMVVFL